MSRIGLSLGRFVLCLGCAFVALGSVALAIDPPPNVPKYQPVPRPEDGQHLALSLKRLTAADDKPIRPFLIWAIGSSYTNRLGNGEELIALVRERFPDAPPIQYRKMVGNSVPWQYIRGWARHLVIPDQPDLVLIYTIGNPDDLEKLIVELREQTTADIIVPTLHVRVPDRGEFERGDDDAPYWDKVREVCRRYDVELVENRRDWAAFLRQHQLPIESLLSDYVHQNPYGAHIVRSNIAAHFVRRDEFSYDPATRFRRIAATAASSTPTETLALGEGWTVADGYLETKTPGARITLEFTGTRVDMIGQRRNSGGTLRIRVDGRSGDEVDAYWATYVQPDARNVSLPGKPDPVRDKSPHGVKLGPVQTPQRWTITMTNDEGEYELVGSVTGADGRGNSSQLFTSRSGQITIEPELWRRAEGNRTGDRFTFEVYRTTTGSFSFAEAPQDERFRVPMVRNLAPGRHTLELEAAGDGLVAIEAFEVHQPPGVKRSGSLE